MFRAPNEAALKKILARSNVRAVKPLDEPKEFKPSKYNNKKVVTEDGRFDSKEEYARWQQLRLLEQAGKIHGLEHQVKYVLAPPVVLGGRRKPALRYIADFRYLKDGKTVVEDKKGFRTPVYRIKLHLMATVHGIEVLET